jgi:benzoyl-CoA reductase/2-hydroxyglutaryl-CoA dehydratase subunit BcrC/BadD/HgdB
MANLIATQFFRGHPFGLEQAERLYTEVKERVDNGLAACENERVRLMYMLVPNWFTPGFYNAFEEEYGAVFAWMGYTNIIPRQLTRPNTRDPVRALASRYVHYTEFSHPPFWNNMIKAEAKKYKIDGCVYQIPESCKLLCASPMLTAADLEEIGIPTTFITVDMVDARDWDDAKVKAQVGSFIETLL